MSGCADVCLDMGYDGSNEFYAEKEVVGRKTYDCCECGASIAVGERHQRAVGKSDGVFWAYRTCAVCVEIRSAFVCGTWVFGMLWETIRDEMFPVWRTKGEYDCLAKLTTPAAIQKANTQYRTWLTDNDDETADAL